MKTRIIALTSAVLFSSFTYAADTISTDMLTAHNNHRATVGSPAVKWSNDLQTKAQDWANTLKSKGCGMSHSGAGENLFWAGAKMSATSKDDSGNWIWKNSLQAVNAQDVTDNWNSEKQWFDYAKNQCNAPAGKACGHYTQVVWKATTEIGCANAACDDSSQVWVCHYAPAGNIVGQKPY